MGHEIITGDQRAALERIFREVGLPAEMAGGLDLLWRQPLEVPAEEPERNDRRDLTPDEIAALDPVFGPLWRSRHGSITWAELLNVLLTVRLRQARTRRYPEMKRANGDARNVAAQPSS